MNPIGKPLKLTVIYCGPPQEGRAFYEGLAAQGVDLTAMVNASVNMAKMGIQGDRDLKLEYSSGGAYRLVPLDFIHKRHFNLGFRWGPLIKALKEADPQIIHVFNEYHTLLVTQIILVRAIFLRRPIPIVCYNFQNVDYGCLKGGLKEAGIVTMVLQPD